jgi:hypothetical protein
MVLYCSLYLHVLVTLNGVCLLTIHVYVLCLGMPADSTCIPGNPVWCMPADCTYT